MKLYLLLVKNRWYQLVTILVYIAKSY